MHEICLGITSYVTLLISLILEQIPSELKVIISRRFKYDDWDSLNLFEIFEEELFTREIIEMIVTLKIGENLFTALANYSYQNNRQEKSEKEK